MSQPAPPEQREAGVEVPYERLDPTTLRNLIEEFVTRDGADWGEAGGSLEEKIEQVLRQLKSRRARVVYDLRSQTANIVEAPLQPTSGKPRDARPADDHD